MNVEPLTPAERALGWVAFVVLIIVLAGCLAILWPRMAVAAVFDCADIAQGIASAADFRDAGADLEKTVRIARERSTENGITDDDRLDAFEREIRRVWAEKKTRGAAVRGVYIRCRKQGGDMGRGS